MPQHLTSIRAAKIISGAEVKGDLPGSQELIFSPRKLTGGDFSFEIGTAGSTMLVFQTLLPAIISSGRRTTIRMRGGTHVPFSPSYHYVEGVFLPCMREMGVDVRIAIEAYGFYPKGGGEMRAEILPLRQIHPIRKIERGRIRKIKGCSAVGNLPISITERQSRAAFEKIRSEIHDIPIFDEMEILSVATPGQGTFIHLQSEAEHSIAGFTALGERGKRAEVVGEEAASAFIRYYATGAAFDPYLPDQIAIYQSMCSEESLYTTSCVTEHLITNLWVVGHFHEFWYSVKGEIGKPGMVKIRGGGLMFP